jgi:hypothetical protein
MVEGCKGGWPLLNGYFAQSFALPSETCSPYTGSTLENTCAAYAKCHGLVKVAKAYYIGPGYYGGNTEASMMKEIRARGPIVADFEVPVGFTVYNHGILSEPSNKEFEKKLLYQI